MPRVTRSNAQAAPNSAGTQLEMSTPGPSTASPSPAGLSIQYDPMNVVVETLVEQGKQAPILDSMDKEDWIAFKTAYKAYRMKKGTQKMVECVLDEVLEDYGFIEGLEIADFQLMEAATFSAILDNHHNLLTSKNAMATLTATKMAKLTEYDESKVNKYISAFIKCIRECPSIRATNSEIAIKSIFEAGLQPPFFQEMVTEKKVKTYRDSILYVKECQKTMEISASVKAFEMRQKLQTSKPIQSGQKNSNFHIKSNTSSSNSSEKHLSNKCTRRECNNLPAHNFRDSVCSANHNSGRKRPRDEQVHQVASANLTTTPTTDATLRELVASQQQFMAMFTELAKNLSHKVSEHKHKLVLVDSGSNVNITPLSDTTPSYLPRASHHTVRTLKGDLKVLGDDEICNMNSVVCDVDTGIISVSKYCSNNDKVMIFDDSSVIGISDSDKIITPLLNTIKKHAIDKKLVTVKGIRNSNDLYVLNNNQSLNNTMQAHSILYHTVNIKNLQELVRFFHESLGHVSEDVMVKMVKEGTVDGLPPQLTVSTIRKHFPNCIACSAGSMSRRPAPQQGSGRDLPPIGEEIVVDLKTIADTQNGTRKSFGGATHAVLAICANTKYVFGKAIKSRKHLYLALENIRVQIGSKGRILKYIRCDNELFTESMRRWAGEHGIELAPCTPYEHHSIGLIERFIRSFEENLIKNLFGKPHITDGFWAEMMYDSIFKHNLVCTTREQVSPWEQ